MKKKIGAHVSASGGVENAPVNASEIGADAFSFFTKNQRQWRSPPISEESAGRFRENCRELGFLPAFVLPHDTYLINMGSPDPEIRKKSEAAFLDELKRCSQLGLITLNFHPGSHRGEMGDDECLDLIASAVNRCLSKTSSVAVVIENTAGQGGSVGRSFEQIAYLVERIEDGSRVGVCLDTCHLFASGHDLRTRDKYERVMDSFGKTVGFEYLKGIHLNDAKSAFESFVDRHESLGKGSIGMEAFKFVMRDERLRDVPVILETPDPGLWAEEIALLRSFEK